MALSTEAPSPPVVLSSTAGLAESDQQVNTLHTADELEAGEAPPRISKDYCMNMEDATSVEVELQKTPTQEPWGPRGQQLLWPPLDHTCRRQMPSHMLHLFGNGHGLEDAAGPEGFDLQLIHRNPHIYVAENFLSDEEVAQLVQLADARASRRCGRRFRASVVGSILRPVKSAVRTSTFFYLRPFMHRLSAKISDRAARLLGTRRRHVEPLQVVRYLPGQEFQEHHDCAGITMDGKVVFVAPIRIATIFVYLCDVPAESGGETEFTKLPAPQDSNSAVASGVIATGPGGCLAVRPKRGRAVIFSNAKVEGPPYYVDPEVAHRGCPLLSGQKLGLNIWVDDEPVHYSYEGLFKWVRAMVY